MNNIERLASYISESNFELDDTVLQETRYGRIIYFNFRDLINDFGRCSLSLQSSLLTSFVINRFDFKNGTTITNKSKLKELFKIMYLKIVSEGIGGKQQWRV